MKINLKKAKIAKNATNSKAILPVTARKLKGNAAEMFEKVERNSTVENIESYDGIKPVKQLVIVPFQTTKEEPKKENNGSTEKHTGADSDDDELQFGVNIHESASSTSSAYENSQANAKKFKQQPEYKAKVGKDADSNSYKSVPVEEFGAAFLRGLGWKEEAEEVEKTNKNAVKVNKKPAFLGVGAQAAPESPLDTKPKRKLHYSPLVKRKV